ncbi:MAG: hypothetical protein JWO15_1905 [Sphingomonadales bacterium]|nr:hypothetical protein [Sphingomonadales bacterium]
MQCKEMAETWYLDRGKQVSYPLPLKFVVYSDKPRLSRTMIDYIGLWRDKLLDLVQYPSKRWTGHFV